MRFGAQDRDFLDRPFCEFFHTIHHFLPSAPPTYRPNGAAPVDKVALFAKHGAPRINEGVWLAVVRIPLPKAPFLDHVIAEADPHASEWANSLRALSGTSGGSLSHGGL